MALEVRSTEYVSLNKESQKISTWNQLDLETLGFRSIMPKILPRHVVHDKLHVVSGNMGHVHSVWTLGYDRIRLDFF